MNDETSFLVFDVIVPAWLWPFLEQFIEDDLNGEAYYEPRRKEEATKSE